MNDTPQLASLHDVRGQPFEPRGAGPLRLVSLVPSSTETLFALGRGGDLVGYTRFCVHPADEVRPEKWIGGTKNPKLKRIIALRPDLVIANREENRAEDVAALEAAAIPVWVAEPRTVTEAIADIRALGTLVGRSAAAQQQAARLAGALAALRAARVAPPPTVAYVIWQEPWMVAGRDSFVAALLAEAGATVPFAGRYPAVSVEALRATDVVLLASEPFPFGPAERQALLDAGLRPDQVRLVDGQRLSWHGSRLAAGLPYAGRVLARQAP